MSASIVVIRIEVVAAGVSRDGGHTWRKNSEPELVTAIAPDPVNPDRIWLGGPDGRRLS